MWHFQWKIPIINKKQYMLSIMGHSFNPKIWEDQKSWDHLGYTGICYLKNVCTVKIKRIKEKKKSLTRHYETRKLQRRCWISLLLAMAIYCLLGMFPTILNFYLFIFTFIPSIPTIPPLLFCLTGPLCLYYGFWFCVNLGSLCRNLFLVPFSDGALFLLFLYFVLLWCICFCFILFYYYYACLFSN